MSTPFRFVPVSQDRLTGLFVLDDGQLSALGARRIVVHEKPGFPCRVSLADAEVGETVLLAPFDHHDVPSPYRASGPIFVRVGATMAQPAIGEVPVMFRQRLLSLRAYDDSAIMVAAEVARGVELEAAIEMLFADERVRYLHIHNAAPGCFNCRVERA